MRDLRPVHLLAAHRRPAVSGFERSNLRDRSRERSKSGPGDQASSSSVTLRVRLGSTWTPGPIVVETVTFLR